MFILSFRMYLLSDNINSHWQQSFDASGIGFAFEMSFQTNV